MKGQRNKILNRDGIFFREPAWPGPIQEMLDTCRNPETQSFYHAQMLYVVGALLRTLAGFLASCYLYEESFNSARLNACIAADLRRPTHGNLVSFLRTCANEQLEWGELKEIVQAIRRLLKIKQTGLAGVPKELGLIDALIRYRNSVIHGSKALSEEECRERTPALEQALCAVLCELQLLCGCAIINAEGPYLLLKETRIRLFPIAFEDDSPMLGIMEGYDTERRRIRYVCVHREWETEKPWDVWVNLLQQRGLSARSWNGVDEAWLSRRVSALLPNRYRLPVNFDVPRQVGEDLLRCIETEGLLPTEDKDLAAALYGEIIRQRFCFILEPTDKVWKMDVYEGLSSLLGVSPTISELPPEHPLNLLLSRVTILVMDGEDASTVSNWKSLELDFPGLQVLRLQKICQPQHGFYAPKELLPALFDALAAEGGQDLRWADISQATQEWIDTYEKAGFIIANPYLAGRKKIDPVRVWREYLQDTLTKELQAGFIGQLVKACEGTASQVDEKTRQLLADLGVLRTGPDGLWQLSSEWARAAVYGVALRAAKGRQQKRLAENPPQPLSMELCRELKRVCEELHEQPPLSSRGGQALLALSALGQKPASLPQELSDADINAVIESCTLLVSWGRTDAVDQLIKLAWKTLSGKQLIADQRMLAIASAVRRHGSPVLAEKLFAALAGNASEFSLRCTHELAGILRDRGGYQDRERAARLYAEILDQPILSPEQRVRSLCGAAENQMWLENFTGARAYLRDALQLAKGGEAAQVAGSNGAANNAAINNGAGSSRLQAMVLHRLATVCLHEGAHDEALQAASESVRLLDGHFQGSFAARCLDIYSRALTIFGEYEKATENLACSLDIKRAMGDRLGLQKGLLQLSLLREKMGAADAVTPAQTALTLAERSGDVLGQIFLHRRLSTLLRHQPDLSALHQSRVRQLSELLENDGGRKDADVTK